MGERAKRSLLSAAPLWGFLRTVPADTLPGTLAVPAADMFEVNAHRGSRQQDEKQTLQGHRESGGLGTHWEIPRADPQRRIYTGVSSRRGPPGDTLPGPPTSQGWSLPTAATPASQSREGNKLARNQPTRGFGGAPMKEPQWWGGDPDGGVERVTPHSVLPPSQPRPMQSPAWPYSGPAEAHQGARVRGRSCSQRVGVQAGRPVNPHGTPDPSPSHLPLFFMGGGSYHVPGPVCGIRVGA